MTPADKQAFAEIVVGFSELKGKTLSRPALALYWNTMQHWTLEDFRAAAEQLLRTCEFMPTPKDFEDLRKAGRPTPGEAWITARVNSRSAISCGNVTQGASCGDPLIDRAVRAIGGYGAIAMCDTDKLHFLERRFAEHYESMQEVGDIREAVPQIACENQERLSAPLPVRSIAKLLAKSKAI